MLISVSVKFNEIFVIVFSDNKVPTTTNTTTSSNSATEDHTVDQPDRDSMVTPKLDDSDYKSDQDSHHQPETETNHPGNNQKISSKQVVTAAPSSGGNAESSDASEAQQAPSSSEIKPEEPSSTTSPLPSGTSSSMSSVSEGSSAWSVLQRVFINLFSKHVNKRWVDGQ